MKSLNIFAVTLAIFLASFSPTAHARLTSEERQLVLESSPSTPDYCSACLRKAMTNHFPHACDKDMQDPIVLASQPSQVTPEIVRCLCIAFIDPMWMKQDCLVECEFTKSEDSMKLIPKVHDFPGCNQWVDVKTMIELNIPGYPRRSLNHKPTVYEYSEEELGISGTDVKERVEEIQVLEEEDGDGLAPLYDEENEYLLGGDSDNKANYALYDKKDVDNESSALHNDSARIRFRNEL
ncbi:hypothetical protein B0O80DRAFT_507419 [Mortierella sp. GBAus27b]|nr:hypothetical protein BGX31_010491 [Mortierella sp. GBA43]KAI8355481.1 hypothetical protein B0O80DRAFT_507419 [Mortierella sp. GBAus27b]